MTTVFGLIVAVLDSVALVLLGIPLAVTRSLLAFITNFIPNVGIRHRRRAARPARATDRRTVSDDHRDRRVLRAQLVVQSIIQSRFIGDAVGLSVTVTFVALVFRAWLLGPLGAILAIPLTLLAKAVDVDVDPRAHALLRVSAKEPNPAPPAKGKSRHHRSGHPQPAAESAS